MTQVTLQRSESWKVFSINSAASTEIHMEKKVLIINKKLLINSKGIMDLNVKMQNYKTSRGSMGKNLHHLGLSDEFPDTTPKIIVKLKS